MGGLTTQIPLTRISSLGLTPSVPEAVVAPTSRRMPILVGAGVAVVAIVGAWLVFASGDGPRAAAPAASEAAAPTSGAPPASVTSAQSSTQSSPLPAPHDSSFASMSSIATLDVASGIPTGAAAAASGAIPQTPPAPTVTGAAAGQSYEAELLKLAAKVTDSVSAAQVGAQIPGWRRRLILARDKAILQVIEADVALNTSTAAQACALWKKVRRDDLGERLNHTYAAMQQSCEGS